MLVLEFGEQLGHGLSSWVHTPGKNTGPAVLMSEQSREYPIENYKLVSKSSELL